jgi:hypothetical protein
MYTDLKIIYLEIMSSALGFLYIGNAEPLGSIATSFSYGTWIMKFYLTCDLGLAIE